MEKPDYRETTLAVDDAGVLARWAEWQGRSRQRAVGAIARAGERPAMFLADEVIVDHRDRRLVDELVGRGGEVVPEAPLIRPPDGVRMRRSADDFPVPVRVRFREVPRIDGAIDALTAHLHRRRVSRRAAIGPMTASSTAAAHLAGLVARHAAEGRRIALNLLGEGAALPLASTEVDESDPGNWWAFTGRARILDAWQLIESRRPFASVAPLVWIAILDGGFWLDPAGVPMVAAGQTGSDFGSGVVQVNLFDENANASGANPSKCSGDATCDWHGNAVASAAAATVGNGIGSVGAGGTVARPILFRSDMSITQTIRCLKYCTAWGLAVVNMSFEIDAPDLWFDYAGWDEAFQFAVDHGVVPVVAAGNDGSEMPDHDRRPATRTPGTITVGALEADGNARSSSNYGSSVQIWAPGTVRVMPDGDQPGGRLSSGTSIAAPIVSGVAAMLRAIDPMLNHDGVRNLLMQTGWAGTGRVTKGLDAYAAVLAAMGGRLTDWTEPNDTRASAAALQTIGPNTLGPAFGGRATRSGVGDDDWWKFTVSDYQEATIQAEWYPRLGPCLVELHPDIPESPVPTDLEQTHARGQTTIKAVLPPDTYRVRVAGNRPSMYELKVTLKPAPIEPDQFEKNDSFERAARLRFKSLPPGEISVALRAWGPGVFRPTLHQNWSYLTLPTMDVDYFIFDVPKHSVFFIPTIRVFDADQPVAVELYDASRALLNAWPASRAAIRLVPPGETTCYLKVSGAAPTRYRLSIYPEIDADAIPGPHQRPFEVIPPWWLDDPLRLVDPVTHYYVDIGADPALGHRIVFEGAPERLSVQLLDRQGAVVREAAAGRTGRLAIDLGGVESGGYVVRVTRPSADAAGRTPLQVRLAPPL